MTKQLAPIWSQFQHRIRCVLSQEYSDEREQLQKKILKLRRQLTEMGEKEGEREEFIRAIRKFMEMRTLTKWVLNELIDHIDV